MMKRLRPFPLFFALLVIPSCMRPVNPPETVSGAFSVDGFQGTASSAYWTPVPQADFADLKKMAESANGSLPLAVKTTMFFQGKNDDLMNIGYLERPSGGIPDENDVRAFVNFLNESANRENLAEFETGTLDQIQFLILRIQAKGVYSMKLAFMGERTKKPLFVDIYVSAAKFAADASEEYERVLASIKRQE